MMCTNLTVGLSPEQAYARPVKIVRGSLIPICGYVRFVLVFVEPIPSVFVWMSAQVVFYLLAVKIDLRLPWQLNRLKCAIAHTVLEPTPRMVKFHHGFGDPNEISVLRGMRH